MPVKCLEAPLQEAGQCKVAVSQYCLEVTRLVLLSYCPSSLGAPGPSLLWLLLMKVLRSLQQELAPPRAVMVWQNPDLPNGCTIFLAFALGALRSVKVAGGLSSPVFPKSPMPEHGREKTSPCSLADCHSNSQA